MKFKERVGFGRLWRWVSSGGLLILLVSSPGWISAQDVDRDLHVGISRLNLDIVLNWFASSGIPYQVESSTTLSNWVNSSLVLTGRGSLFFVTNPIGRLNCNFYRVNRLLPPANFSASFNPSTGILTIPGDTQSNAITVSRNAAGAILVNGGALVVTGGTPTVANTLLIRMRFDRVNPAPFFIDIGTSENLVVNMNGGIDSFSATGNLAALIQITVDGGAGDDTILGSNGPDLLLGGDNNDVIDGQPGVIRSG